MNADRWRQVDTILKEALEKPSSDRCAFLDGACESDASLRQEVEALIRAYETAGSFLESPILKPSDGAEAETSGAPVGLVLGHYDVKKLLASGGMGSVYQAEDRLLGRQVAIKVLPRQFTSDPQRVARFAQEARTVSALNHPNIITIYEIGETDQTRYIVTEYIEGETLRRRMAAGRMKLLEALDLAMQVAAALEAAHQAGIVHRDIKLENVMVRPDGYVKVVDFGLAKLAEVSPFGATGESSVTPVTTESGLLLGTPRCMSPEQARGETVDARTDIFSLGVVLYEMVTGRPPFRGTTTSDVIAAILRDEPMQLTEGVPEVPLELERIVTKALQKNRDERYQTAQDLLADLKRLKEGLSIPQSENSESYIAETREQVVARKFFLSLRSQRSVLVIICVLAVLAAGLAAWFYLGRRPVLTNADTILLADFENKTGEDIFDGILRQGLAIQLTQTPFLQIFPDTQTRQTLRLMARSPDERVRGEVARGICIRQNLKAYVGGTIARLGSHYVITLEAIQGESGQALAHEQIEAEGKERVMSALSLATRRLRGKLGESLASIERFHKPLEEATTADLEAFRFYSRGTQLAVSGRILEAISYYERATQIDPDFGSAYSHLAVFYSITGRPALAADRAEKAFQLRDRLTEQEKLRLTFRYHVSASGNLDKAIEVAALVKQMYPRWSAPIDLALAYDSLGKSDQVILHASESIRLIPQFAAGYRFLAKALVRLNRFAEAADVLAQAQAKKLDMTQFHSTLYQIAFIKGDTAAMQQQVEWTRGKPDEYVAFEWQTGSASFSGQWRKAREHSRRARELAVLGGMAELAAEYATQQALRAAVIGDCRQARADAAQGLKLERGRASLPRAALALALCGDVNEAKPLVAELSKAYPEDTILKGIWLPAIRVAIELREDSPAAAVRHLETASRYEAAAEFWPQYLRGLAWLKAGRAEEAAVEFQRILDRRGEAPLSVLCPLAKLGAARAAALAGDVEKSRKAFDEFFTLWARADADVPVLSEARKDNARLTEGQR